MYRDVGPSVVLDSGSRLNTLCVCIIGAVYKHIFMCVSNAYMHGLACVCKRYCLSSALAHI